GRVPDAQLAALRDILARPDVAERFVVVATHYALCRADGSPDRPGHGLDNSNQVIDALAPIARGVFLHGHIHQRFHVRLPSLRIDICCAGSTTHSGREGLWVVDVDADGARATPGGYEEGRYVLFPERAVALGGANAKN